MTKIMELAQLLGKAIKEDERIKNFEAAEEAYKTDADLQYKMTEYNVQTMALTAEYKKADRDTEVIEAIEKRLNTLTDEISALPVMIAYNEAQNAVNELMNEVNAEIQFHVTGKKPSECTHDCSTCAGCH